MFHAESCNRRNRMPNDKRGDDCHNLYRLKQAPENLYIKLAERFFVQGLAYAGAIVSSRSIEQSMWRVAGQFPISCRELGQKQLWKSKGCSLALWIWSKARSSCARLAAWM